MNALQLILTSSVATFFISQNMQAAVTNAELESQPDFFSSNYISYDASVKGINKLATGIYDFPTLSDAPEGYTPFYISHYGRHGSRYHYSQEDYSYIAEIFEKAASESGLTPFGRKLFVEMSQIRDDADERAGDLTPIGREQHRGIARRMVKNFPAVFTGENKKIDAKSTTVVRCALSMTAFCQELNKICPNLDIDNDASSKYQYYMCHGKSVGDFSGGNSNPELAAFYEKRDAGDAVLEKIFSNKNIIKKYVNREKFVKTLYYMLISLQGVDVDNLDERNCSLTKVFTLEEMALQWQAQNLYWYKDYANCPLNGGVGVKAAASLVGKIKQEADDAIKGNGVAANLRFGHDTGLLPLVALLNLDGAGEAHKDLDLLHNYWQDFSVIPMAGNLQIIFYRKNDSGVNGCEYMVKFLLNEREVRLPASISTVTGNYYDWKTVREYLSKLESVDRN